MTADTWEQARHEGHGRDLTAAEVFDLLIPFGALRFANAPTIVMIKGETAVDPRGHAERLLGILFPRDA